MSVKDQLLKKLDDKSAIVAILGMGYVGMPLAVAFAEAGFASLASIRIRRKLANSIVGSPTSRMCRIRR